MGLFGALDNAIGGIELVQARTSLLSQNIARSDVAGYVRKSLNVDTASGFTLSSRPHHEVRRYIDDFLQTQFFSQSSSVGALEAIDQSLSVLDKLIGSAGGSYSLDTVYADFLSALNNLSANPQSAASLSEFISKAQGLTASINKLGKGINELRKNADDNLHNTVGQINIILQEIADHNNRITATRSGDSQLKGELQDHVDKKIGELAQLINVKTERQNDGSTKVYLSDGIVLTHLTSGVLEKKGLSAVSSLQRGDILGSIELHYQDIDHDIIADKLLTSGKLAGYLDLRDNILLNAIDELDSFAAAISQSIARQKTVGSPVSGQNGFTIDTSSLTAGDSLEIVIRDDNNIKTSLTFLQTSQLPLSEAKKALLGDNSKPIDFSQGIASTISQLSSLLGSDYSISQSASGDLQIISASAAINIEEVNAYTTASSVSDSGDAVNFFTDSGGTGFSGSIDGVPQIYGFSQRIEVNDELVSNPDQLVRLENSEGRFIDASKVFGIYDRLFASHNFNHRPGYASSADFTTSPSDYLREFVSSYSVKISHTRQSHEAQTNLLNHISNQFQQQHGVNIEQEMANLVILQNSFSANARLINVISEMMDVLLRI